MIKIDGTPIKVSKFESHEHVCDLIELDGPLLSLYTDSRDNWLYLWCDTDNLKTNRWMLLRVARQSLVDFFERKVNLRFLLHDALSIVVLDEVVNESVNTDEGETTQEPTISVRRKFRKINDIYDVQRYWPSEKSFFRPELAQGVDVQQAFVPAKHLIPVNGRWYFRDLDIFSRSYAKLYAFLYSTKPQFIGSMGERLAGLLRAPWTGGYSRVNLFNNLRRGLPALHDLQIERFNYASPGAIEVEALPAICEDLTKLVLSSKDNWPYLNTHDRIIDTIISKHKLKKEDLSSVPSEQLPFSEEESAVIQYSCEEICRLMGIADRTEAIRYSAPNLLVYAKAVQALIGQAEKLIIFEEQGLLNLTKSQDQAKQDVLIAARFESVGTSGS